MLKTGRIPVILIHASVWLLFFSVPYSTLLFSHAVPLSVIYRFSILNLLLVSLFYFNTEVLVPKLLLKDKLVPYVLSAICMVALFPMAVWASTHFGFEFELFDAGLNHGEGQLPFPAVKDKRVAFATLPPLLVIAIGTSIKLIAFRRKYQGLEEQRQKEQLTTELAFLKSQINPHFFFNTLNNIYALVEVDVDKAKDGMHKLSKLMRYHLYKTNKDYVEVRSELEFLKDYLQLMRLRLQDVVQVRFNENLAQNHALIPPLLLEPFVENAFKHGVSYSKPSHIEIELTSDSNYLHFSVRNSLSEKGDAMPDEGGLGIQNVVRRLALIFPDDAHELKYGVRADEYVVEMKLPLKYD